MPSLSFGPQPIFFSLDDFKSRKMTKAEQDCLEKLLQEICQYGRVCIAQPIRRQFYLLLECSLTIHVQIEDDNSIWIWDVT